MIRTIQNIPAAGQTPQKQTIRRGGADFGSMLQRQIQDSRQEQASGFQAAAVQAAAEASQAAAIRQAMGIQPVSASGVTGASEETLRNSAGTAARQTVNFSKHALARAEERGIQLTDTLLDKLADSVERAQEKGAKNILAFDTTQAFIINIPYSRVITAISQEEMRENIFTNIDGAVLL